MERLNPVDIKIIIATHKKYWLPKDSIYLPLQVGAEGKKIWAMQRTISAITFLLKMLTSAN